MIDFETSSREDRTLFLLEHGPRAYLESAPDSWVLLLIDAVAKTKPHEGA